MVLNFGTQVQDAIEGYLDFRLNLEEFKAEIARLHQLAHSPGLVVIDSSTSLFFDKIFDEVGYVVADDEAEYELPTESSFREWLARLRLRYIAGVSLDF